MTAGDTTNDVTDTLTSRKLKDTIDDLRDRYNTAITLSAPAVASPEACAVTPHSDATLIIIRVASSSMTDLEITARVLLQVNTKIARIIANDVPNEHTGEWRRYLPMSSPSSTVAFPSRSQFRRLCCESSSRETTARSQRANLITMKQNSIAIIGAGGFAREVLDVIVAANLQTNAWNFVGFVADDEPDEGILDRIDAKWLGTVGSFLEAPSTSHYVIGIGDCSTRRSIARKCDELGLRAATVCHPSATLGEDVVLGPGTIVCSHVSITTNVHLGDHVHVNLNSTIGHDSRIGNFVTINPLVAVSGDVTLEDEVTMGTHSSVLQGLRVAKGAFVGAGAVVVRDVEPGTTVVGIPARPLQSKPGH